MSEKVGPPASVAGDAKVMEIATFAPALREHVREIVESPAFRGSRRSQQFLRYVVEAVLDGHSEKLKERSLGVELFARPASYDTGEDAIVRVTASDVRKRLHQFYSETGSEIRIELPTGSYIPEFHRVAASAASMRANVPARATTQPAVQHPVWTRFRWPVFCAAIGLSIVSGIWLWVQHSSAGNLSPKSVLPWSAIVHPDRPVHIILSDPDISAIQRLLGFHISLSDYANRRYWPTTPPPGAEMERVLASFRGAVVPSVDVGITLDLSRLAASSQQWKLHTARSLQLGDFKSEDDFILLGSPRSNPWSGLFQDQLDFEFSYDENLQQEVIRNRRVQPGELPLYVPTAKGWDTGQAFAMVAFVGNPRRKGHILLLAGTNAEGTEAAGKVATDLDLLSRTLQRYGIDPAGPLCYFEVLLQVKTMAGSPTTFEVKALHRLTNSQLP